MESKTMHVEIAYALPRQQRIVALELSEPCSVREAARRSGLQQQFPELDMESVDLGIFGKVVSKPDEQLVADGDRVEIYRPLIADPKEVRKQRAAKVKAEKAKR
ncbi:RnfH family protein [Spongiibacter taiwanensis]|uniref:RnfH family protein n=1 Tax=Spongiibacter taiwanensis TaxID=1748242 RepID=UPI002035C750|nr:RnfH family protein [Spongiibacter taiwanensis]USA44521.1 RnfH family protein [Spongiibacter taiwanensis]